MITGRALIRRMSKLIFGPAPSRRLGRSLGINLVNLKTCNMDCLYCELGKSKATVAKRQAYIKTEAIIDEFTTLYPKIKEDLDTITLTGAGEPTLNTNLGEVHQALKNIVKGEKQIAILTNGSGFLDKETYKALLDFDIVVPSLDACREASFQRVNKPNSALKIDAIISNLQAFSKEYQGKLLIEVLLCKGINDSRQDLEALISTLKGMQNYKVQLGTIHRPPAYTEIERVSDGYLLEAASMLIDEEIPTEVIGGFSYLSKNLKSDMDIFALKEVIISLLRMRPCSITEMSAVFLQKEENILKAVNELLKANILQEYTFSDKKYYKILSSK